LFVQFSEIIDMDDSRSATRDSVTVATIPGLVLVAVLVWAAGMGPIAAYGRRGDWSLSFDSLDLHFPPDETFIPVLVALTSGDRASSPGR
jgi:hypothetical protein